MKKEDIIRMAIDAGFEEGWVEVCNVIPEMEKFSALVAAAEREACAKVCRDKKPLGNMADDWAARLLEEAACDIDKRSNSSS